MNTSDNSKKELLDITFIDPDDLIEFHPESTDETEAPSSASEVEQFDYEIRVLPEDELEYSSELVDIIDSAEDYVTRKQEDTRGRLAVIYTLATFFIFILGFGVAVLDGINRHVSIIDNLKELLPILSGIFLGSLGFILGYYFRKSEENNN